MAYQELRALAAKLDEAHTEMELRAQAEVLRHIRLNMSTFSTGEGIVNVYGEQALQ